MKDSRAFVLFNPRMVLVKHVTSAIRVLGASEVMCPIPVDSPVWDRAVQIVPFDQSNPPIGAQEIIESAQRVIDTWDSLSQPGAALVGPMNDLMRAIGQPNRIEVRP